MNLDFKFVAERPLANHCAELLATRQEPEDHAAAIGEFTGSLLQALPARLKPLLAGTKLTASCGDSEIHTPSSLNKAIGTRAANFTLDCGDGAVPLLISIDLKTALSMTDLLFGGDGKIADEQVKSLPRSATLVLQRIVAAIGGGVAEAAEAGDSARITGNHENVARLAPFPRGARCLGWTLELEREGGQNWPVIVAAQESDIKALVAGNSGVKTHGRKRQAADPTSQPYNRIPLPLRAVLAEFALPVSRLAALEPGDVLPIALARDIPLRSGATTLAHGTIGALDDRVALRLTKIS